MKRKAFVLAVLFLLSLLPQPVRAVTTGTLDHLTYSVENEEVTITGCDNAVSGEITVPDTIEGYPVTKVGDSAFAGCAALTRVTLPDTVREIGNSAFSQCKALVAVDLPTSLESLGSGAFYECTSMTEFKIPKNYSQFTPRLTYPAPILAYEVEEGSPYYCTDENGVVFSKDMTTLVAYPRGREGAYEIPNGVVTIGASAFSASNITSVSFPDTTTTILNGSFSSCYYLSDVDFTDNISFIGELCFTVTALTEIIIPSGVTEISYAAFKDSQKLERLVIHSGVKKIGRVAFTDCYSLKEVVFMHTPQDTLSIQDRAFAEGQGHPSQYNKEVTIFVPDVQDLHPALAAYDWAVEKRSSIIYSQISGTEDPVIPAVTTTADATLTPPVNGWVEGTNTFTVSCDDACVVAVSYDGGATYTRLTATAAESGYSFTVENVTSETLIGISVQGDSNGDGKITNADITRLRAAYAGKIVLDGLQNLAVDANGDGKITNADITRLRAAYAGKVTLTW